MSNTIASILGIPPVCQTFIFEGRSFQYIPAMPGKMETLYTDWADGARSVTNQTRGLDQALAVLLSHRFRRGVSGAERADVLARARTSLSA